MSFVIDVLLILHYNLLHQITKEMCIKTDLNLKVKYANQTFLVQAHFTGREKNVLLLTVQSLVLTERCQLQNSTLKKLEISSQLIRSHVYRIGI